MPTGHQFEIQAMKDGKKPLHPAWTGIGCILVAALMGVGYLAAGWFMAMNNDYGWVRIPREFSFPPSEPYLFFKLVVAFVFLLFSTAIITLVYALVHPPKPGKYDVTDPSIFPSPPKVRKR